MTVQTPTVSVIIASRRLVTALAQTTESVWQSATNYPGNVEILIVRDEQQTAADRALQRCGGPKRIRVLWTGGNRGSAYARLTGVADSSGDILLFTDDDVLVPADWVTVMATGAQRYGAHATRIASRNQGFWASCDERIDTYRVHARDTRGRIKFVSFPSFALRRDLLPARPFSPSRRNLADDVELSCTLRLSGIEIHLDKELVVHAYYPNTFAAFVQRKIRHGVGVGRLRCRLGHQRWNQLEMGSPAALAKRWVSMSAQIAGDADWGSRTLLLIANLAYCLALVMAEYAEVISHRVLSGTR